MDFVCILNEEAINNIGLFDEKLLEKATVKENDFRTDVYKRI